MPVLYSNFAAGTITDAPLLIGATTVNSAAFANLPEVVTPDTMWLVLDPAGVEGAAEIVQVTAHTAAATSVTVVRARQSTSAREHPTASVWRCAVTKTDADEWATTTELDAAIALVGGRGVVGWAVGEFSDHSGISTTDEIDDMEVLFTAIAGRLYKATLSCTISQQTGSGSAQVFISTILGSMTPSISRQVATLAANGNTGMCLTHVFTASGSIIVVGQAGTSANTMTVRGESGYRRFLVVEDIGAA